MVRKWQPLFHQAVLEYHGSVQRLKDLAAADVPRAVNCPGADHRRPRGLSSGGAALGAGPAPTTSQGVSAATSLAPAEFETIASQILDAEPPPDAASASPADAADSRPPGEDHRA